MILSLLSNPIFACKNSSSSEVFFSSISNLVALVLIFWFKIKSFFENCNYFLMLQVYHGIDLGSL